MADEARKENRLTVEEAHEDIERVEKSIDEPRWWETLVRNQKDADAVFELAREMGYKDVKPGSQEKAKEFLEKLGKGMYIGPLESYAVKWGREKITRDIWQNFFDGNNYTLDGIQPQIKKVEGKQNHFLVRIEGQQEYDFRKLLHFGGTAKEKDPKAAGGFGEGAKIASFLLLRDHNVPWVKFGSGDWVLEYYLDTVPEEQYDKPIKGLHVRVQKTEHKKGNFVEFESLPLVAASIQDSRDLFYHSENPDFKNPTFKNSLGGFRWQGYGKTGHLYEAGQRRHYVDKDQWDTVEGLTLWLNRKMDVVLDRDRGAYNQYEIERYLIKPLVNSMLPEEVERSIYVLKEFWEQPERESAQVYTVSYLLESLIDRMAVDENIHVDLDKDAVSAAGHYGWTEEEELLANRGFTIYRRMFKALGVPYATEVIRKLQEKNVALEISPKEKKVINALQKFIESVNIKHKGKDSEWKQPSILLFDQYGEATLVHGRYAPEEGIWLAKEAFYRGIHDALVTYVHELAHEASPDHEAEFSYTHDDYMQRVLEYIAEHPDEFYELCAKFKALQDSESRQKIKV